MVPIIKKICSVCENPFEFYEVDRRTTHLNKTCNTCRDSKKRKYDVKYMRNLRSRKP